MQGWTVRRFAEKRSLNTSVPILDKPGEVFSHFAHDYFPRRFYYKRDAKALLDEIKSLGAEGHVEKGSLENSIGVSPRSILGVKS